MTKQLLPIEIIENSSEKLFKSHKVSTYIIYNLILLLVLGTIISTFFISVDVNASAHGIVKDPGERITVNSPYSAFIRDVYVRENDGVKKGDTLLILDSDQLDFEIKKVYDRLEEIAGYLKDLRLLVNMQSCSTSSDFPHLATPLYRRSLSYYIAQRNEIETKIMNATSNFERNRELLRKGIVAPAEFEQIKSEYDNLKTAADIAYTRQINEWQLDLDKYINEERELSTQLIHSRIKNREALLVSPAKGNIQKINGIEDGSFVQQGQLLFEITPSSGLIAECLVSPRDIGYIKNGQTVKIQVDAFDYNEWGLISGKVVDVFNDVTFVESTKGRLPYFKVICSMDASFLKLKNGYLGHIRQGMTINCRFKLTKRTLFQLLYDRIDDWMNPNVS